MVLQDDAVTAAFMGLLMLSPERSEWIDALNSLRPPDWHARAACAGADVAMFIPSHDNANGARKQALAICDMCPVRVECLEWALSFSDNRDFGILGGMTRNERRTLRKRRQAREVGLAVHPSGRR